MAQKPIREFDAKTIICDELTSSQWSYVFQSQHIPESMIDAYSQDEISIIKPDMLFGKRGKEGLIFKSENREQGIAWMKSKSEQELKLSNGISDKITVFIAEPLFEHNQDEERYLSMQTTYQGIVINFSYSGGVEIEENWDKVSTITIPFLAHQDETYRLIKSIISEEYYIEFVQTILKIFIKKHFCYLEFNPFIMRDRNLYLLDCVARVDSTIWEGQLEFPQAFGGGDYHPAETIIRELDAKTGASLKLSVLNPHAQIWTILAGGGASIVYIDTLAARFPIEKIGNYGEYSGNPSRTETRLYCEQIFQLMINSYQSNPRPQAILIGGAIANFTDVAKTFQGICDAIKNAHEELKGIPVTFYIRRGGPNWQQGYKDIERVLSQYSIPYVIQSQAKSLTEIVYQIELS